MQDPLRALTPFGPPSQIACRFALWMMKFHDS
jgi:hypothetical protein